ncbi:hypothetical protein [Gardnerella vaginalis]|uniref:hypothetical protein n=1 Tax=Gardnerella TaxID=2701 RepID=UPI000C7DF902|nr:hypothetical protein [Gardnerella vaginalis]NSX30031.1 hypothetical protein [Gardnerella vaginalis]PKZ47346.1 hypothetical protein CYJ67_00925 [Gardnerella vaginalis]
MMNKKAIAAFAAGATLLAGFAMATPAMADADTDAKIADLKTSIALLEAKMKNNNLKPSEEVLNKYDQAKTKFEETDKALTAAYAAYDAGFKAYKAKEVNKDKTTDDFDKDDTDKTYGTEKNQSGKGLSDALEAAKTAYNTAKTAFNEAKGKVAAYNSGYTKDVADLKALKEELAKLVGGKTTTSQPSKPEAKPVVPGVHVKAADKAKAAAKGELAAKGGNGKSGEKLGNAGVGVALTALAASMLAGMGAAVRKMRH